ncbi:hypothetical protein [Pediococcus acidilactici]|uniref:hypothetical protein n=1 Tax=Pediococcus acidilactici TaxID=1254 RepID=UPI00130FC73A|nr:hypothetical protein [Pediococcus acidilactici]KAF0341482.1 hypothetical protein GBO42_04590 [Pediococcus acidilactici]KAF0353012.1 hypothetical protein GBO46_04590 [Pediococcus acidilactici]KAF0356819.1 hypothetical protein GBO48_04590 [Pediococcus acidilactici]KAF0359483.1 hypothetical protein GBO49_07425 [Pediococcus acidilactici]KAF0376889.1 hypothetical protein GBO59_04590 [Pediococcus acidilactici]
MDIQTIITSLVSSGTLGFLNHTLLVNQGTFSSYSSKEDKIMWYSWFALVNYCIFQLLASLIHTGNVNLNLASVVSCTVIISFLFTKWIFPLFANIFNYFFNHKRSKKGFSGIAVYNPRETAFNYNSNVLAFIFDFDHKFITEGFITNYSNSLDLEHQILLEPQENMDSVTITEDSIIDLMNENYHSNSEIKKTKIYLDTKNKLKYYLIYF